ncbi:30S ribosomal protein S4e [Candidatus Micrarchaeota archaeon]|nr:30S ribosomal protein S4e [Candidatus Micrarchaeota archaeon]
MAKHGGSRHLKRISAPFVISIARKKMLWLKKASPGPHAKKASAPLAYMVRDFLHLAVDFREAKHLIKNGEIAVDGVPVRDEKRPVGLMDVVSIPKLKQAFRTVFVNRKLSLVPIPFEQVSWKYCKIVDKRVLKKGKTQLVFHDGRTVVTDKGGDFKPGDSVKLSIPKQAVKAILKREKGAFCYIPFGKHSGELAKLAEILERKGSESNNALLKEGEKELITLQDYLFVVDENFKTKA